MIGIDSNSILCPLSACQYCPSLPLPPLPSSAPPSPRQLDLSGAPPSHESRVVFVKGLRVLGLRVWQYTQRYVRVKRRVLH